MKRTTISLPDELAAALERAARRREVSVSEVARSALASHLGLEPGAPREVPFAAVGRSGGGTTARDVERELAREWDAGPRRS
jgi:hypothetical protein